jgi:hypothetical protein
MPVDPAPAPPARTGCHSTGTARHRLAKEGFTPASNHAHRDHMAKYGAHPLANTQALATVRTENAPGQCPTWPISLLQDGQLACSVTHSNEHGKQGHHHDSPCS